MPMIHTIITLMKERSTLIFNVSLLLLALCTGSLLWNIMGSSHSTTTLIAEDYDAFAIDIVSTQFSDRGTKHYELSSPRLNHYKLNNQTYIDAPMLRLYNQQQENWLITSHHAQATRGKSVIEFIQDVDISGAGTRNHKNTQLLTEKIDYYPRENIAETLLPITIVQPGSMIHAIGMKVAFNVGTITLLSNINGSYDPNVHA